MLAGMTKTAASDVKTARFGRDGCANENQDQHRQERQSSAIKKTEEQCQAAKNLQPWQIKRQPQTREPRQNFIIIDIKPELDGIQSLDGAGVNENCHR